MFDLPIVVSASGNGAAGRVDTEHERLDVFVLFDVFERFGPEGIAVGRVGFDNAFDREHDDFIDRAFVAGDEFFLDIRRIESVGTERGTDCGATADRGADDHNRDKRKEESEERDAHDGNEKVF